MDANAPPSHGCYGVVIPAYEAAKTIKPLVQAIKRQGLAVIVVDDGSRDRTAAHASAEGAIVISHLRNRGKGQALRTGFAYALRGPYDGVITMDSDGQHDPADIPSLIRAAEQQHAAMVLGNRTSHNGAMPRARRWTNRVMSEAVSAIIRQPIPDSQCGFRLIRREVLQDISLRTTRFEIETEVLLLASAHRWKIISVPIRTIYQAQHASYIHPAREAVRFIGLLLGFLLRRKHHTPR